MRFSIRALLATFLIAAIWLGALLSRSAIAIELASLFSIGAIFLSLPLAIFDTVQTQRAFCAGFFAVGFGTFLVFNVGSWMDETSDAISLAISNLPRFEQLPERNTVIQAGYVDANLQPLTAQNMASIGYVPFQTDVRNALPFLASFVLDVFGGIVVQSSANPNPRRTAKIEE